MSSQQQQLDVLIVIDGTNIDKPCVDIFSSSGFVASCLNWVSKLHSPNVIVVLSNQPNDLAAELLKKWASKFKKLQAFCVPNCQSLNDVLREVDFRQILRNDFMLIQNLATFCFSYLTRQIEKFRNDRRQNKKNVLTLLYYSKPNYGMKSEEDRSLIGYIEQTQKLTHYENIEKLRTFTVPKSAFLHDTIFRVDLLSCGIALCGIEFSGHFAGNYDLLSFDAIITDILSNEEILMQNILVDFVDDIYPTATDSLPISDVENKKHIAIDGCAFSVSPSKSLSNLLLDDSSSDESADERDDQTDFCGHRQQIGDTQSHSSFVAEVVDSLQGALEDGFLREDEKEKMSGDLLNKIKLEVNASKLAYNIPAEEVPGLLFTAFLSLPGVVDKFSEFTKMYNHWRGLWKMFYRTTFAQSQMLFAIEEKASDSDRFRRVLPKVLYFLSQEVKAMDDALIVDWYSKLEEKSQLKNEEKLAELVTWLQNAEESSETDDD
ncbi:hypothetical protein niasHS_010983 [Heterodera schachtii]|uniref:W2 domain-containing protein n=1 Tax=Heterodera schachtii TaxID=97005 RepID=A0ABD2IV27_HETSC